MNREEILKAIFTVFDKAKGDEACLAGAEAGFFLAMKHLGFTEEQAEEVWAEAKSRYRGESD